MIEIVSPGNKSTNHALRSFVQKATELLEQGVALGEFVVLSKHLVKRGVFVGIELVGWPQAQPAHAVPTEASAALTRRAPSAGARRPPGEEGLTDQRATAGIPERSNLTSELGEVGAPSLPAILEVADVGL